MANSAVELDFFRLEKENSREISSSPPRKLFHRNKSFREIQGAISKMNPELLKSVIGSVSLINEPQKAPISSIGKPENSPNTAPLTIFYNGSVAVFDVPKDKADEILKIAEGGFSQPIAANSSNQRELLVTMDGDLPIARRKSLQRFLAKRQPRVALSSPYFCQEKDYTLSAFGTLNL